MYCSLNMPVLHSSLRQTVNSPLWYSSLQWFFQACCHSVLSVQVSSSTRLQCKKLQPVLRTCILPASPLPLSTSPKLPGPAVDHLNASVQPIFFPLTEFPVCILYLGLDKTINCDWMIWPYQPIVQSPARDTTSENMIRFSKPLCKAINPWSIRYHNSHHNLLDPRFSTDPLPFHQNSKANYMVGLHRSRALGYGTPMA